MKRIAALALSLALPTLALADVAGIYRTEPNKDGHTANVQIAPCGSEVCGTIVSTSNSASTVVGMQIVWGMKPAGANAWSGGKIKDPTNNKVYSSKMSLNGNTLSVSGCVLGICRAQNWTRVK